MLFDLPISVYLTVTAICHLKYFMHTLPLKFCALLEPTLKSLYSSTLQKFFRDACINKAENRASKKSPK